MTIRTKIKEQSNSKNVMIDFLTSIYGAEASVSNRVSLGHKDKNTSL